MLASKKNEELKKQQDLRFKLQWMPRVPFKKMKSMECSRTIETGRRHNTMLKRLTKTRHSRGTRTSLRWTELFHLLPRKV